MAAFEFDGKPGILDFNHLMRTPPSWSDGNMRYFYLQENHHVVATGALGKVRNLKEAYGLTLINVIPEEQGKGLGRVLIRGLESEIRKSKGTLSVVNAASEAQVFYRKNGYVRRDWQLGLKEAWPREAGPPPVEMVHDLTPR